MPVGLAHGVYLEATEVRVAPTQIVCTWPRYYRTALSHKPANLEPQPPEPHHRQRALLRRRGATVAHCPSSNAMLRSGMLNVRQLLDDGVRVSLGTDVSGGASPSMLEAIREAVRAVECLTSGPLTSGVT